METLTKEQVGELIPHNQKQARHRGVTSGVFMESVNLVVLKAAEMIAPYKSTENKYVVLKALTDVFMDHGFNAQQALVLAVKAYNS